VEPRPAEGFQELQKVGRVRKGVRHCVALRAVGCMGYMGAGSAVLLRRCCSEVVFRYGLIRNT
jgi:hypothetical protein